MGNNFSQLWGERSWRGRSDFKDYRKKVNYGFVFYGKGDPLEAMI